MPLRMCGFTVALLLHLPNLVDIESTDVRETDDLEGFFLSDAMRHAECLWGGPS